MQNSKLQIVVILSTVLFGSNVAISADDNNSDKNKEGKVIILQKKKRVVHRLLLMNLYLTQSRQPSSETTSLSTLMSTQGSATLP